MDYGKAKKEKLCFDCLSNTHTKRDCPQVKSKKQEKGKGTAMHRVQVLSLEYSPKYVTVEVSHSKDVHECCLIASMWQETFGLHDLVCMHGTILRHKVRKIVDDGAMHYFLNYKLVKQLKLQQTPSTHRYVVSTIQGDDHDVWDTKVDTVSLSVQGHNMIVNFQVMNMSQADVILGREWLHGLGPPLKRSYEHNSFTFKANGAHV